MRAIIISMVTLPIVIGAFTASARDASVGYTTRGYRYDNKTCSAGFQSCFERVLKTGWQNGAASSYCSQACGVFPASQPDRYAIW